VIVGLGTSAPSLCRGDYRVVARIRMPVDNDERGQPVARCTLAEPLARLWPRIVALSS
jgi:hypothetical protein